MKWVLELKVGEKFFDSTFDYVGTVTHVDSLYLTFTWEHVELKEPWQIKVSFETFSRRSVCWYKVTPLMENLI